MSLLLRKLGRRQIAFCLAIVAILVGKSAAADYRISHCVGGCPLGAEDDSQLVVRSSYALSFSSQRASASWIAYRLRAGALGIASSLSREPIPDTELTFDPMLRESLEAEGAAAGMSRVGLIPLVNVARTPYWREVNHLSASTFRTQSLDRGAWSGLEWSLRNLVNRRGEVYVVAGPLYEAPQEKAAQGVGRLPTGFFKLIVSDSGELSVFRFDQQFAVHVHHCNARSSLKEIEAATGLRFFPNWEPTEIGRVSLDAALGCSP